MSEEMSDLVGSPPQVRPIIFYDTPDDIKFDESKIDTEIKRHNYESAISKVTHTANKQLSITATSLELASTISKNLDFFSSRKRSNINDEVLKPAAVNKNISYDRGRSFFVTALQPLEVFKIINLTPTNKRHHASIFETTSVKVLFNTTEERDKLVNQGIKLGLVSHRVEISLRTPQCTKNRTTLNQNVPIKSFPAPDAQVKILITKKPSAKPTSDVLPQSLRIRSILPGLHRG